MYIVKRSLLFVQSALKSYGPSRVKQFLWDKEYSSDKWDFADNTAGDCVYRHLEKYASKGSILDLGCGTGNTSTELDAGAYRQYIGVDISQTCLDKATRRSKAAGRADKNQFVCSDFINYVPRQKFDVILFRESLYHVPMGTIPSTIEHYAPYLKDGGVFVVRMKTADAEGKPASRPLAMFDVLRKNFKVVEDREHREFGSTVVVFRPTGNPVGTPV
jgi:SAM-dependent methyltransferase